MFHLSSALGIEGITRKNNILLLVAANFNANRLAAHLVDHRDSVAVNEKYRINLGL